MKIYPLIRQLLFQLDPERAHYTTLNMLKLISHTGMLSLMKSGVPDLPVKVMGIDFPNPVGLAAGFDRSGEYGKALSDLGFGFIEVGTVTPDPEVGYPKPRIFRLPKAKALINRMGFYNKGLDYLLTQLERRESQGVLGINIAKNRGTPTKEGLPEYVLCFKSVYPYVDYIAINISSPNTPGLRDLQYGEQLKTLIEILKETQAQLTQQYGRYVPMLIKVAPDLDSESIEEMSGVFRSLSVDGVIATNTTIARDQVAELPHGQEQGGLSGGPLMSSSTEVIRLFHEHLGPEIPIIGCGGTLSGKDAVEKLSAGASLVQLYTGLIYQGPGLIREIVKSVQNMTDSP